MDFLAVRKALDLLKIEGPANRFVLRLASAFPEGISKQPVRVPLAELLTDLTQVPAELLWTTHDEGELEDLLSEVLTVFTSLAQPRLYPMTADDRRLEASIVTNFMIRRSPDSCVAEFSSAFVALVKTLA